MFADAILFDEENEDPNLCSEDWNNDVDFTTGPFSSLVLDPMDSLFDFEHAAKPDLPSCNNMLEYHYNRNNTESEVQVIFDDDLRPNIS